MMKSRTTMSRLVLSMIALSALTLSACSENSGRQRPVKSVITESETQAQMGNNYVAALAAADMGEMLLTPSQFAAADEFFDKALSLDPKNPKANFYSAMLKPFLAMKGYTKRFLPLMGASDQARMKKTESELSQLPIHYYEVVKYLTSLPAASQTKTAADLQAFTRENLQSVLSASAEKMQTALKAGEVELRLNARAWSTAASTGFATNCEQVSGQWSCTVPEDHEVQIMKADSADLKMLSGVFATYTDYFRLMTAYDLTDLEKFEKEFNRIQAEQSNVSPQQVVALLNQYPKFLKLTSTNELSKITTSVETTLNQVIELGEAEELCKDPARLISNVLLKSICVSMNELSFARSALEMLAGPALVELGKTRGHRSVKIRMDLAAFLKSAPSDIRDLLPTSFTPAGEPIEMRDPTMGGLFPDGDFLSKMQSIRRVDVMLIVEKFRRGLGYSAERAADRIRNR